MFRSTSITSVMPTTSDDLWTCEAVSASGSLTQTWTPDPSAVNGALYTITGTWGAWTMTIRENASPPKVLAVMPLTFATVSVPMAYAASLASYYPACIDGTNGITTLNLFGVETLERVIV
jgi:hypothetical protein